MQMELEMQTENAIENGGKEKDIVIVAIKLK